MKVRVLRAAASTAALALAVSTAFAFQSPDELKRYDGAVQQRLGGAVAIQPVEIDELAAGDALRTAWQSWTSEQEGAWRVYLDERTGVPTLVSGAGVEWAPAGHSGTLTLEALEARAREFLDQHEFLIGSWRGRIELDEHASLERRPGVWQLVFRQSVDGVRVENSRFDFLVNGGRLVAFGTHRWSPVAIDGTPEITADEARTLVEAYLGYDESVTREPVGEPELVLMALDPRMSEQLAPWDGARGEGITHKLAWRVAFEVPGEVPLWIGEVDAKTGDILAFYDGAHYVSIRGGVFPINGTGDCATGGCNFPHPMPFADFTEDGQDTAFTDDFGFYTCTSQADPFTTTLDGPYVRIDETCGPVEATGVCGETLDLGLKAGENCLVEPGAAPGNTAAARSAFFHINRVAQAARAYLPDNTWLQNPVVTNTNVNNTCNASWSGEINMFRGGNGCGNTGENQGVLVHEWGHGFDQNDGGGYDNTSEAYADAVALFYHRDGCIGPGFFVDGRTCSGYGDSCLECTGVRDHDRNRRVSGAPPTPAGFVEPNCPSGSGPCGRSVHCESYPIVGSLHDLATVELPAMGYDEASAWQLAERLWYESRGGSGGDIYTCSLPNSDSCSSSSWYQAMRVADDDDGDLANGTPHAAAIFASFSKHGIACGEASDPENQNSGACPTLDAPALQAVRSGDGIDLSWDEVPGAASYTVFRGDLGCDRQHITLDVIDAPTLSYFDDNVDSDFIAYYRVRPNAANPACTGFVSNCVAIPDEAKLLKNGERIDDAGPNGNGSGILEPGETIKLPVTLFNYGTQDASGVAGTLRTANPDVVRVIRPNAVWPDIARGEAFESVDPHFEVTVFPEASCGDVLTFTVDASATGAESRQDGISIAMGVNERDYVNDENQSIPNRTEEPVISTITVDDARTITDLDVSIDISVFRSSDLVVDVTSPSGTTVRLKNRTNGGTSSRYDRDRQPDGPGTMADFVGEPLQGTWTLAVSDEAAGPFPSPGTLDSWAIHAEVQEPFDCETRECGDALPGAVPGSLLVTRSGSDLVFDWEAAPDADGYNVLSDVSPLIDAPTVAGRTAAETETTLADEAQGAAGSITFYRVRATNSCNLEGP